MVPTAILCLELAESGEAMGAEHLNAASFTASGQQMEPRGAIRGAQGAEPVRKLGESCQPSRQSRRNPIVMDLPCMFPGPTRILTLRERI